MKLVRFGQPGEERAGLIDGDGCVRDLTGIIADIDGANMRSPQWAALRSVDPRSLPNVGRADTVRLGACVGGVGKLICMGLNERSHSHQMGMAVRSEPVKFYKPTSSITGPNDPIIYPKVGRQVDWETELAIVVGTRCKYVEERDARKFMAGFCIVNDVSDRYWQLERGGGQASTGKQFDTFAPLGPYLVTPDDMQDPDTLRIRTWVNGVQRQDFSSADYIFKVDAVLSYCSQLFTLEPGDVIAMGSGPGNAAHWGGAYLKPGDVMRAEIEGLGAQENTIVAEAA